MYDGLDLIAELDGTDTLVASYTHGPGIDDPLVMRYDGDDYFYHKNHLGSIMEITNIYQTTVKTYDHDAFGAILGESGSLGHNAFTYTGREYHANSGLYYYRARFYDPAIGRFITQDPIGHLGGVNLYAYVGNRPIHHRDSLGLMGGPSLPFPPSLNGPECYGDPYIDLIESVIDFFVIYQPEYNEYVNGEYVNTYQIYKDIYRDEIRLGNDPINQIIFGGETSARAAANAAASKAGGILPLFDPEPFKGMVPAIEREREKDYWLNEIDNPVER